MLHRRLAPPLALVLIAGLTACSPAASPDPTPTYRQFASEEEAFEAAEETYRAYIAAQNAEHTGTPAVDPTTFLHGALKRETKELKEQAAAAGLRIVGEITILSMQRIGATVLSGAGHAELLVCLDSSLQRVLNQDSVDVTPEQQEIFALRVEFSTVDGVMLAHSSLPDPDQPC
ncbi:hypothetical protein [Microbacterium stercoris]|uniref:Lipoprotein n=1 Tax=Microbacterium stercoris TaxID=2820289 RepID=A0A939QK66_9MICO|nr:hypothetical protein [Microbacterium stercoris]MBO3663635.1 hypothetical protein [Microbacterium stercoris]